MNYMLFPDPSDIGVISNKGAIKPDNYTGDLVYTIRGWAGKSQKETDTGYSFRKFWGNCYHLLGELGEIEGMQQLCQQYYLQNGRLNAQDAVTRIKKLLTM